VFDETTLERGSSSSNRVAVRELDQILCTYTFSAGNAHDSTHLNLSGNHGRSPAPQSPHQYYLTSYKTLSLYDFLRLVSDTGQIGSKIKFDCLVRPQLALTALTVLSLTTELGKLLQILTISAKKLLSQEIRTLNKLPSFNQCSFNHFK